VSRKSCAACRKAKVKCNSEFPQCLRCVDKDLVCVYELTRRSENLAHQPVSPPLDEPRFDGTSLVETSVVGGQNEISWDNFMSSTSQALPDSAIDHSKVVPDLLYQNAAFGWEPEAEFVEELERSHVRSKSFSNISGNDSTFDWFSSGPLLDLMLASTSSTPVDCMFHTPYLVLRPMDHDLSSFSLISPRSPFIHSPPSPGSQIGRNFLIQSMQSYTTLLTTSTLPPFIHIVSLPTQGPSLPSSAPLEICKSIVSLYASKTAATSPFIWRAITMEKDRFLKEIEDVDDYTTLSMLQAITLYILLRIFDQDSFSVDFDCELVSAMTVRYPKPKKKCMKYNKLIYVSQTIAIKAEQRQFLCQAEVEGWRPDWKEWVLLESKRRLLLHLLPFLWLDWLTDG
jgi:hypothetical protein